MLTSSSSQWFILEDFGLGQFSEPPRKQSKMGSCWTQRLTKATQVHGSGTRMQDGVSINVSLPPPWTLAKILKDFSPSLKRCGKEIPLTQTWVHHFCQEIIEEHRSCERNLASKRIPSPQPFFYVFNYTQNIWTSR